MLLRLNSFSRLVILIATNCAHVTSTQDDQDYEQLLGGLGIQVIVPALIA